MYQIHTKTQDRRGIIGPLRMWLYLGGCVVLVFTSIRFSASLMTTIKKRAIVEERETMREQAKKKNEELLKQSAYVVSPYFIEKEAREKLGLGREGESVVLFPFQATEAGNPVSEISGKQEKKSNVRLWWELFF